MRKAFSSGELASTITHFGHNLKSSSWNCALLSASRSAPSISMFRKSKVPAVKYFSMRVLKEIPGTDLFSRNSFFSDLNRDSHSALTVEIAVSLKIAI